MSVEKSVEKLKIIIVSDYHGRSLNRLDEIVNFENIDVLISLGDFDQVKTIKEFMDLEKRLINSKKKVISEIGNHDYCILNGDEIESSAFAIQCTTFDELHKELNEDIVSKTYITSLASSFLKNQGSKFEFKVKGSEGGEETIYSIFAVHAGLSGNLKSYSDDPKVQCPESERRLWYRPISTSNYLQNFQEMKKNNVDILIRGHDHNPEYFELTETGDLVVHSYDRKNPEKEYELVKTSKHMITVGAYCNGYYGRISEKDGKLFFRYNKFD